MSLIINTNMASIAAQNNLTISNGKLQDSVERLSSGLRIVKAADDAAGLAISEKLRAKIRASAVALRNSNDGVSMLQTAEGALNEVSSILVRMRELATQAASPSLGSSERATLNDEFVRLKSEIDRIAQVTEFNGQVLVNGASRQAVCRSRSASAPRRTTRSPRWSAGDDGGSQRGHPDRHGGGRSQDGPPGRGEAISIAAGIRGTIGADQSRLFRPSRTCGSPRRTCRPRNRGSGTPTSRTRRRSSQRTRSWCRPARPSWVRRTSCRRRLCSSCSRTSGIGGPRRKNASALFRYGVKGQTDEYHRNNWVGTESLSRDRVPHGQERVGRSGREGESRARPSRSPPRSGRGFSARGGRRERSGQPSRGSVQVARPQHPPQGHEINDKTKDVVVKVFSEDSGELIRQIPSEEVVALRERLADLIGVLFRGRA